MTAHTRFMTVLFVGALLALPGLAAAQEANAPPIPVVEVSGGYMLMRDTDLDENFPGGWYFSGAANLTRWFGLVGEAGGSYKKLEEGFSGLGMASRLQLYTFLGGPRFFYQAGRVVPFAQVLAGAAHARAKVKMDFPDELGGFQQYSLSETDFAIQPGGGVTIYLSDRVGVRLAADYRALVDFSDEEWDVASELRGMAGLTFGWGAR
jgi:opacity protein-like surface antigen